MHTLNAIIEKELKTAFHSVYFYVVFILALISVGFIYWFSFNHIFATGEVLLTSFFRTFSVTLFFLIPFLTMRSITEELKGGTFELLFSKPLYAGTIIRGKFLALFMLVILFLLLTSIYYLTLASLSHVDHAVGISGYLGLLLTACCYISIGLFASSLTNHTILALLISFSIGVWFEFLFQYIAEVIGGGFLTAFFNYLSFGDHFDNLSRGIIDSRDLIYFLSVTLLFLGLTQFCIQRTKFRAS